MVTSLSDGRRIRIALRKLLVLVDTCDWHNGELRFGKKLLQIESMAFDHRIKRKLRVDGLPVDRRAPIFLRHVVFDDIGCHEPATILEKRLQDAILLFCLHQVKQAGGKWEVSLRIKDRCKNAMKISGRLDGPLRRRTRTTRKSALNITLSPESGAVKKRLLGLDVAPSGRRDIGESDSLFVRLFHWCTSRPRVSIFIARGKHRSEVPDKNGDFFASINFRLVCAQSSNPQGLRYAK